MKYYSIQLFWGRHNSLLIYLFFLSRVAEYFALVCDIFSGEARVC